jgi:hypothetical protein
VLVKFEFYGSVEAVKNCVNIVSVCFVTLCKFDKMHPVLIELKANVINAGNLELIEKLLQKKAPSFKIDMDYPLIPMQNQNQELSTYLIRGEIDDVHLNQLESSNEVLEVFKDSSISPF